MKTADYPVWLAVMPDQRGAARADAGTHPDGGNAITWSPEDKLWYARPGADLSRLQAWLPDPGRRSGGGDPETEFLDALTDAGLIIDGLPVMDGEIHRVSVTDGPRGNGDGVYRGFLNGSKPGGWFINYWTAKTHKDITKWKATGGESDPVARLHMQAVARQARDDSARALAAMHMRQTARAKALYDSLPPADPQHAYFMRKGVTADEDIRQTRNGALVVPLQNVAGDFRTLQYIPPDGEKYLFKEAPKAGNFKVVGGELRNGEPVLYAEGYATAKSLSMATGLPVVMTVDAGNMLNVADALRAAYPDSPHLFMADDDHHKPVNTGRVMAEQAARNTGGAVLMPVLTADERRAELTDFNDVHHSRGIEALRADLRPRLNEALAGLNYKEIVMDTPDDAQPAPDNLPAASPDTLPDAAPARRPGAAKEKTDEILKLRDEGLKPAQIADQLGIGQTSVYRILKAQQSEAVPAKPPEADAANVPAAGIDDLSTSQSAPAQKPISEPDKPDLVSHEPAADVQDIPVPEALMTTPAAPTDDTPAPEPVSPAPAVEETPVASEPQPTLVTPMATPVAEADILRTPPVIQGELRGALSALIHGSITPEGFRETTDRLQRELNQVRESGSFNDAYVGETQAVFDRLTGDRLAVSERPGMFSRALSAAGLKDSDTMLTLRSSGYVDVRTVPAQLQSLYSRLADGELARPQLEKMLRDVRNDLRRAELSGQQSSADVQTSWAAFGRLDLAAGHTEGRAVTAAVAAMAATPAVAAVPAKAASAVTEIPAPAVQPEKSVSPDAPSLAPEPVVTVQNMSASAVSPTTPVPEASVTSAPELIRVSPDVSGQAVIAEVRKSAPVVEALDAAAPNAASKAETKDFSADFADINYRLRALRDEARTLDTDVLAQRLGSLVNERIGLTEMWAQGNDTENARAPSEDSETLEAELRAELVKRPADSTSPLAAAFGEDNAILVGSPRLTPQDDNEPQETARDRVDLDKLISRITHEKHPDGKSVLFMLDGEPAFVDRANRLVMAEGASSHEEKVLAALLTASEHYHGKIELTGSDEFKAFAIGLIVANDLKVSMKNASQQLALTEARRAAGKPVSPAAPADAVHGDQQAPRADEAWAAAPVAQTPPADVPVQAASPVTPSSQQHAAPAPVAAVPKISPAVHTPAEKAREPVTGKVTAFGQAPFRFEPDASESTFITLRTKEGPQTFWGKELAGLLREANLKTGRMVTLQWQGKQPVTVKVPKKNAEGVVTHYENENTHRNRWSLSPAGGTRVQTGADDLVPLAAMDVNRYTQIQHALVSRLGLDIDAPPRPADGLYWLKPDGQGSSQPGDSLSAPRPVHNERAGVPVMSSWGEDGRPDMLLVQGDGDYLQGVMRQNGIYQHVLVSLPGSPEAPPMVVNLLTPEGAQPIGSGNGINRSNGQPVAREHVVVRLTGDAQPRIAKLDVPAEVPAALHARLGYDERYKAESGWVKEQPAAAPQAVPATPPRPAQ